MDIRFSLLNILPFPKSATRWAYSFIRMNAVSNFAKQFGYSALLQFGPLEPQNRNLWFNKCSFYALHLNAYSLSTCIFATFSTKYFTTSLCPFYAAQRIAQ